MCSFCEFNRKTNVLYKQWNKCGDVLDVEFDGENFCVSTFALDEEGEDEECAMHMKFNYFPICGKKLFG